MVKLINFIIVQILQDFMFYSEPLFSHNEVRESSDNIEFDLLYCYGWNII